MPNDSSRSAESVPPFSFGHAKLLTRLFRILWSNYQNLVTCHPSHFLVTPLFRILWSNCQNRILVTRHPSPVTFQSCHSSHRDAQYLKHAFEFGVAKEC